jgi:hypothetical protein
MWLTICRVKLIGTCYLFYGQPFECFLTDNDYTWLLRFFNHVYWLAFFEFYLAVPTFHNTLICRDFKIGLDDVAFILIRIKSVYLGVFNSFTMIRNFRTVDKGLILIKNVYLRNNSSFWTFIY